MSRFGELIIELCPDGVAFERLGDAGVWYGGGTPSKSRLDYWKDGTIPWVSPKDMGRRVLDTTEDYVTEEAVRESATRLVPPVSVAMVVRSSILDRIFPTALIPIPVALNQDMKAVVPRADILPEYLAHLLCSRGEDILRYARKTGGSVASIESRKLYSFRIPVPPLEVQREIVRVLDQFTQLEAELEAELEARRLQYEHYRAEILNPDPGWRVASLGEICEVFDGPHATPKKTSVGPWYLSISSLKDGNVDLAVSAHLAPEDYPKWTRRVAPRFGDTLFSYETRIGQAAYWNRSEPAALGRRMGLLRPIDSEVVPKFLTIAYLSPGFQKLIEAKTVRGSTVDRIPIADMQRWPISIPSVSEQYRIIDLMDQFDALVNDLSVGLPAELAARRKQYEYYRDRLLSFKEAE